MVGISLSEFSERFSNRSRFATTNGHAGYIRECGDRPPFLKTGRCTHDCGSCFGYPLNVGDEVVVGFTERMTFYITD